MFPRRQLTESEARVLRSLIEEWPYDAVEQVRVELTRGWPLAVAGSTPVSHPP